MKTRAIIAIVGLAAIMVLAACSNGEASETPAGVDSDASGSEAPAALPSDSAELPMASQGTIEPSEVSPPDDEGVPGALPETAVIDLPIESRPATQSSGPAVAPVAASVYPSIQLQTAGSQAGIWVTGRGSVALNPDLAVLNIGVEATAKSVSDARDQAATAMAAILVAVRGHGLTAADVQTRSFNIYPQYEWRDQGRVLIGYVVSNTAAVKIRDLDLVGPVIDDVADAGGDNTRIDGISFTVEDPAPFMTALREAAVNDAMAKAEHFASLTGVTVGPLAYITELGGGGAPVVREFAEERAFAAAAAPPTQVSGGELELTLSVQAVFAIR